MATMRLPHPRELDKQCRVSIHKWVDLYSLECKELDDDYKLTVKWFTMLQGDILHTDLFGRLWGRGNEGLWYPYHIESYGKTYGLRISAKAAN